MLFFGAIILALFIYKDYGISWDEPLQRTVGIASYDYVFNGSKDLLTIKDKNYGAGYELLMIVLERSLHLTDSRDVYLARHLAGHMFFLLACLALYVLSYQLFKSRILSILGFLMMISFPRVYAHSFFNSKDLPFLSACLITITVFYFAVQRRNIMLFLCAGILCGFTTSIRILGILPAGSMIIFLLSDILFDKEARARNSKALSIFLIFFPVSLILCWPYLWQQPLARFIESYRVMAHYDLWGGFVIFKGAAYSGGHIPLSYLPTWMSITLPVLWLLLGCGGILYIVVEFARMPIQFINDKERRFMLLLFCLCVVPIVAVICLHSVIYDDWRHLYFVYPYFVLLVLYAADRVQRRAKQWLLIACTVQLLLVGYFMWNVHPFQQVYFNELVSHDAEYLHKNYDMEYWGCSYKQALDYLVTHDHSDTLKIRWDMDPLRNNILLLKKADRDRIRLVEDDPDYMITTFRGKPGFPEGKQQVYAISVLNSTITAIYKW